MANRGSKNQTKGNMVAHLNALCVQIFVDLAGDR